MKVWLVEDYRKDAIRTLKGPEELSDDCIVTATIKRVNKRSARHCI